MPRAERSVWAARALVAAALVAGVAALPRAERAVDEAARASDVRVRDGVPQLRGQPVGVADVVRALRTRPSSERVRIVNEAGVCQGLPIVRGQGTVYWLQYQLLPRALTCDEDAPWTVYMGVAPPPGARAVVARPPLVLVRG